MRKKTKVVRCGNVLIGGDNPISVQSMTTTDPSNINATVDQIRSLEEVSCDIVRVAIPNMDSAMAISKIKELVKIPIVADIHFDYRLALEVINQGIDGLRLNPGNIGDYDRIKKVAVQAKERNIPIRIGVNGGSLEKDILQKYGHPTADAMVESAMRHVKILEDLDFDDIVISLKASDIKLTVDAYSKISEKVNYPLHLGITEAGTVFGGTIKSSVGIGSLLLMGIGDTIRVSLTGHPVDEIKVGREILKSIGLLNDEINVVSCPTCGRCQIDLINITNIVQDKIKHIKKPIKVAIMGCAVNGPGEARDADIGIAGGSKSALLFKKGEIIKKISEEDICRVLLEEIDKV